MNAQQLLSTLTNLQNPKAKEALSHFKITTEKSIGITTPVLKKLAKQIGRNHQLALELWASGVFEARAIAALIEEPEKVTKKQMETWVKDFDNWAICDACCCYLFRLMPDAYELAKEWSTREREFEKRAGFSLMAYLAVHDKKEPDAKFTQYFPFIKREATDERNFVRKAVNWGLRQIGKRNIKLNALAIKVGKELQKSESKSARWIAADALRELEGGAVQKRLREKA